MQQYCIIHGKPKDENGLCEKCPQPKPLKEGSKEQLQKHIEKLEGHLENQREAFEVMTNEFNNANGNVQAEREKNKALQDQIAGSKSVCVHCGDPFESGAADHWLTCEKHPAGIKVAELEQQLADEQKNTCQALEALEKERVQNTELEVQVAELKREVTDLKAAAEGGSVKAADAPGELGLDVEPAPEKPATTKTGGKGRGKKKPAETTEKK